MASHRKVGATIALIVSGAILGTAITWIIAQALQFRAGQAELESYSKRTLLIAESASREARAAYQAVLDDHLPFCSDQELSFMRQWVFNAAHVKDIGHFKDGYLICTMGLGRLPKALAKSKPDMIVGDVRIYTYFPLLISPLVKGIILEYNDISVVLNPADFVALDEPPMDLSILIYDRDGGRVLRVTGHPEPLTAGEVISQRMVEHNGIFYQPLCSKTESVCVVAAEARTNLTAVDPTRSAVLLVAGGLVGIFIPLTLILVFNQQRTFLRQLRRAIRRGALTVRYQPVVDLESGAIVGAEALARWVNEEAEDVPPDVFIAVAEEKGFIGEITRLVMNTVLKEIGGLLKQEDLSVTVNITVQDLCDPGFFVFVEQCVNSAGIAAPSLGFELTERSTADRTVVQTAIARLRSLGHPIYIDDFGTGYSSLAYLHELSVDAIKIDRAFTRTVGTDAVTASVVPQILDIANQLQLQVVVEGIETAAQAEYFRRSGPAILGQGWLFGRPVPAAQFRKLLTESIQAAQAAQRH